MSFLQPLGDIFNVLFKEPIYNVLILLYHVTSNFALSIVLLTILIRACLIPLTRKQLQSSRKMQELQPQIKALQAKYRGDPQGLMQAQRELFKENNYSQAQGCLPLLIQMPMLYALFFSFSQLLSHKLSDVNNGIYPFIPKLSALPNTLFMWMDLAHPDPLHILPILAGVLTFIQLRMAMPVRPKRQPGQQADATTQATQTTMYIMPVITIFFGLNFPAGMALYWCVGTLFMAVQQYFLSGWGSLFVGVPGMERFVPEPKILPTVATATPAGARALTAARPAAPARNGAAPARNGAAPAAETPAQPGGFRGMLKQLREQMAAMQRQTAEQQGAKNGTNGAVVDSTATVDAGEDRPFAGAREEDRQRAQRPRPSKQQPQGPMLVKPAQRAEVSPTTNGAEGAGEGEAAEAAAVTNGAISTPAPAPASTTPSTSKAGRAAGSATQIRPPAAGQRKSSGSGKGGPNSGRPRQNGRPKGGR